MSITVCPATASNALNLAAMNKLLIEDEKHDNAMTLAELEERIRYRGN